MRFSKTLAHRASVLIFMPLWGLLGFATMVGAANLELVELPGSPGALLKIDLKAPSSGESKKLLFLRQTGETELKEVEVFTNVTDLNVEIAPKTVNVPKAGDGAATVTLTVSGAGRQPNTIGSIFAKVGSEIQTLADLKIGSQLTPSSVSFDSTPTASKTIYRLKGTKNVDVRASIKQTGGQELEFTEVNVELVGLSRKWKENTVQVSDGKAQAKGSDGQILKTLHLEPNGTTHFTIRIDGLADPGEYQGTVRLSAPHLKAIESEISVMLRYHWWIAAILIGFGVLVAELLRWFLAVRRNQLIAQRRVAAIREELDRVTTELSQTSPLNDDEERVTAALRLDLQQLLVKASRGEDISAQAAVLELKLQVVPRWIHLRQEIQDANEGQDQLDKLVPVGQWLKSHGGTEQEMKMQLKALDDAELELKKLHDAQRTTGQRGSAPRVPTLSVEELSQRLTLGENMVTLVLLVVSVGLGLELLYYDSLAWGAPYDLLRAALWGLGLHAGGKIAFGGIAGLRKIYGSG